MNKSQAKTAFLNALRNAVESVSDEIMTEDGQWTVKGFIDVYRSIYTISSDTKIVSKILELHLLPKLLAFAEKSGYVIVLADHQNYYPDISFVNRLDESLKFAVDFKTTYRLEQYPGFCNGFTLGSHGEYFRDRTSTKNIQFPYSQYAGHFCLGIIYSRSLDEVDETEIYQLKHLRSIASVIGDFQFFVQEKWKIASDTSGSGNTANIGSISKIDDIVAGNGMFSQLGEKWFDDFWMNYGAITDVDSDGKTYNIRRLVDFVNYRQGEVNKVVPKARRLRKPS